jgi:succinate dehydrogenase/fumarate reductase cytochrome b subunit
MTTQPAPAPHTAVAAATDGVPSRWQRFLALSGVAFAVPFLIGWFASAGVTPHYTASDQDWTNWAHDSKWHGRISGFAMLVAAFLFLHYLGAIRSVLGKAESAISGSAQLARVVFAGALIGIAGMSMALVVMEAASSEGGNANPVVSRAVTAGAAGPYLIAAMGFAAFLMASGVLTLPTRVFARWTGIVALLGAASFLVTFLTVLDGTTNGSPFGYGFFPGVVALVTWTIATSVAMYRAAAGIPEDRFSGRLGRRRWRRLPQFPTRLQQRRQRDPVEPRAQSPHRPSQQLNLPMTQRVVDLHPPNPPTGAPRARTCHHRPARKARRAPKRLKVRSPRARERPSPRSAHDQP